MCKCTPEIKTPFCGKIGCEWSKQEVAGETIKEAKDFKTNKITKVIAFGKKSVGNAYSHYKIVNDYNEKDNELVCLSFQNGPIKEVGVNGIMDEDLLGILIDRLASFQKGQYACDENNQAISCLKGAVYWLKCRTKKRQNRGVEGTHEI